MVINKLNAAYYKWGNNCEGWRLLQTEKLSVIEERMPPATAEVRHYHHHAQQLFYILSGTAEFELGGTVHVLSKGDSLHVLPGLAHQVRNTSAGDLIFLLISEPPTLGDRIENF